MNASAQSITGEEESAARAVMAQTRAELLLTARRGENILITVIVPIVLLVFFASLGIISGSTNGRPVDFLLPGMLALAIIATGMVSLGIATAYERYYGVLKRLGASPLPRGGLILAKALSVVVLEVVQVALLVFVASVFYGWRLAGSPGTALLALLLGSIAFAGLGLAMAGALRAEATLAGANGLYLFFLLLSGAVLPLDHLPVVLQDLAHVLPAAALTGALRSALTAGAPFPGSDVAVLVVWAIATVGIAARTFKWE